MTTTTKPSPSAFINGPDCRVNHVRVSHVREAETPATKDACVRCGRLDWINATVVGGKLLCTPCLRKEASA